MSTSLITRRALPFLISLAMVFAFVSTTQSARAEGPYGASVATILAAEATAGAPIRPHTTKAKPAAKPAKSKHGRHASKKTKPRAK